jgi:hypothetical protein
MNCQIKAKFTLGEFYNNISVIFVRCMNCPAEPFLSPRGKHCRSVIYHSPSYLRALPYSSGQ